MLTSTLEKAVHRKGTQRFIESDPTDIVLIPVSGAVTDGTVKFLPQSPRSSQRFKLIWGGESGIVREIPDGSRRFDFILVGAHDATVAIGDTFTINNNKYVVDYLFPYNDYEVKAGGVSHGADPGST
jgi:hypothetical protein